MFNIFKRSKKPVVVLFNYGGGLRGVIPARLMAEIESRTGRPISEMVDIFAGPSTGAILNAAMNVPSDDDPTKPKFKAKHMVHFYEREGANIFPRDRFRELRGLIHDVNNRVLKNARIENSFRKGHYDPAHLGICLQRLYGDMRLGDSLKSIIIPTYNINGDGLHRIEEGPDEALPQNQHYGRSNFLDQGGHAMWLKHIKNIDHARPTVTPNVSMRDAVLASTAAPTYFPCHHFEADYNNDGTTQHYSGIDGSIFDNPCISYYGAIRPHIPKDRDVVMILLGTGFAVHSFTKEQWNSFGSLGVVDPANDLPLINILFQAPESALAQSFRHELSDKLHIFNKSLTGSNGEYDEQTTPNIAIDDASPENFKKMNAFSDTMIEEMHNELDTVCDILEQNAQASHA